MHTAVPLPPTPPLLIDEEGRSQYYERSPTPPLDISRYHLEDDEDEDSLQNEFNPFDPVWGIMYRSRLNISVEEETKCLEKIGTRAALRLASEKLNSIGMSVLSKESVFCLSHAL
jgi:hypothetical protein